MCAFGPGHGPVDVTDTGAAMMKGPYFHHSMLSHCEDKYSSSTEWLGSVSSPAFA